MIDRARRIVEQSGDLLAEIKPRLRGWLHLIAFPLATVAGLVLMALAPDARARLAAAAYTLTSSLLFGISALYHRGNWSARARSLLKRLDHSSIYLIIAGSYTPFALLVLHGTTEVLVLSLVWAGAVLGLLFRMLWVGAPRWLYTPLYIALGWIAAFILPNLLHGAGIATTVLIIVGGGLYTIGALVYGTKRPNPSPRWFGFHEVFHALTIAAWVTQYVAVSFVTYRAVPA